MSVANSLTMFSRKCQGAAWMGARADPQGEAITRPRTPARPHVKRTPWRTPLACGARRITRANRSSRQTSRDSHAPDIPQAVTTRTRAAGRSGSRRARGCGGGGAPVSSAQRNRMGNPHGDKNGSNLFSPLGVCEGSGEWVGVWRVAWLAHRSRMGSP